MMNVRRTPRTPKRLKNSEAELIQRANAKQETPNISTENDANQQINLNTTVSFTTSNVSYKKGPWSPTPAAFSPIRKGNYRV